MQCDEKNKTTAISQRFERHAELTATNCPEFTETPDVNLLDNHCIWRRGKAFYISICSALYRERDW